MNYTLHHGDCLDILRTLPDNSVDAIVTDPPYGLSFMGKRWDYDVPSEDIWRECLRVLKPGGHLLAFAGTRTQHRMAVRIEDAGFEIRDMIAWVYGSGFPKSLDVSKAIDKAAGAEREVVATTPRDDSSQNCYGKGLIAPRCNKCGMSRNGTSCKCQRDSGPATPAARQWQGWGTALKPALEPITVARKPLIGTVAENVLTWGTGGVNVDGCRVEMNDYDREEYIPNRVGWKDGAEYASLKPCVGSATNFGKEERGRIISDAMLTSGRWPANLIHDGSEEVVGLFPAQAGANATSGIAHHKMYVHADRSMWGSAANRAPTNHGDSGSAARFFYCAKASKRDRDEGCEGMEAKKSDLRTAIAAGIWEQKQMNASHRNHHPTVKPTDLMRYLCRLVTPPNGTVLDPFMGSGSTGKAALLEDFAFIGIEREAEYLDIARARIEHAIHNKPNRLL